jgi:diguanylate cyclase (GGDEF)-like protein
MPDDKDHICTGANCIYCQITADEKLADHANSLAIVNERALSRVKSLGELSSYVQYETTVPKNGQLEQWEKLAFNDSLTGLFNIHVFMRELKYEIARAKRYKRSLTIGIIRIDNYQEIRNGYGPLGCELILKHTGKLLQDTLREVDIAARLQLEQFGIILPETNQSGGNIVAERIRQGLVKRPVKFKALTLDLTCSIGLASFPKHGLDLDSLLDSCLNAQTEAANKGGNRVLAL